jgi:hypothetical protein
VEPGDGRGPEHRPDPGRGGSAASGKVGENGTFKIPNVTPGKNKVTVTRYPKMGDGGGKPGTPPTSANKTLPETWDVSSSNKTFTLDMSKVK